MYGSRVAQPPSAVRFAVAQRGRAAIETRILMLIRMVSTHTLNPLLFRQSVKRARVN